MVDLTRNSPITKRKVSGCFACYGLRHLYMGDKETDSENYLYYANTFQIAKVFETLRGLELKHCTIQELE